MTLEERMDSIERALGSQDELVRELRAAVTVAAELEARQARLLKEHGQWLADTDRSRADFDNRMKDLDNRIAGLVSGFGEFLRRNRPDPARG